MYCYSSSLTAHGVHRSEGDLQAKLTTRSKTVRGSDTQFGIPSHEARGKVEAKCARLQILGVVIAVWSQYSDNFMFGFQVLIRDDRGAKGEGNTYRSKENVKKSMKSMKVTRCNGSQQAHKLDSDRLILFAMFGGEDYNIPVLPECSERQLPVQYKHISGVVSSNIRPSRIV